MARTKKETAARKAPARKAAAKKAPAEKIVEEVVIEAPVEEVVAVETAAPETAAPSTDFDAWWEVEGVGGLRRGLSQKRIITAAAAINGKSYADIISSDEGQAILGGEDKFDVKALCAIAFK